MNDPTVVQAAALLKGQGYIIPMDKTEDKETGGLANRVELLYKDMGGYSRMMEFTEDGRASARKIGPLDIRAQYLSTEYAWNFRGLKQFTKIKAGTQTTV